MLCSPWLTTRPMGEDAPLGVIERAPGEHFRSEVREKKAGTDVSAAIFHRGLDPASFLGSSHGNRSRSLNQARLTRVMI